ncbi:MAG: hypothetical protein ACM3X1_07120 [Ignavibacteriales bacterium]
MDTRMAYYYFHIDTDNLIHYEDSDVAMVDTTFNGIVNISQERGPRIPLSALLPRIILNGNTGSIGLTSPNGKRVMFLDPRAGRGKYSGLFLGEGKAGIIVIRNNAGRDSLTLDGANGDIMLYDKEGKHSFSLHGLVDNYTGLWVGAGGEDEGNKPGKMFLRDSNGKNSITIDGANSALKMRNKADTAEDQITLDGANGDIMLYDKEGKHSFSLHGKVGDYTGLWIGASESEMGGNKPGKMFLRDSNGKNSITIDGKSGRIEGRDKAGNPSLTLDGGAGRVVVRDKAGNPSLTLDGGAGDIFFNNADCAEDFDISELADSEPGTVMVISQEGKLQQCSRAYDKKVVGVISGAGRYKPGVILDKKKSSSDRKSISLIGKVYCKVDARSSPVEVGDLLTTSSIPGHAMKATDPKRAFGAVIGKALYHLKTGKGLIPILVALQ